MKSIHQNYHGVHGLKVALNAFSENDEKDLWYWGKAGGVGYGGFRIGLAGQRVCSFSRDSFHPKVMQLLAGVGERMMPDMCPLSSLIGKAYSQGEILPNHFDGDGFGEIVLGISLGTPCFMVFAPDYSRGATGVTQRVLLPRRSLYIMSRQAMVSC